MISKQTVWSCSNISDKFLELSKHFQSAWTKLSDSSVGTSKVLIICQLILIHDDGAPLEFTFNKISQLWKARRVRIHRKW